MDAADIAMSRDRNMYLIYLTRDPRASAMSRKNAYWKSVSEDKLITRMRSLCHQMAVDYTLYSNIQEKYKGRILHIKFEELALEPTQHATDIYAMLGYMGLPSSIKEWILKSTTSATSRDTRNLYSTHRNSSQVVYAWKEKMSQIVQEKLTDACHDILSLLGYN